MKMTYLPDNNYRQEYVGENERSINGCQSGGAKCFININRTLQIGGSLESSKVHHEGESENQNVLHDAPFLAAGVLRTTWLHFDELRLHNLSTIVQLFYSIFCNKKLQAVASRIAEKLLCANCGNSRSLQPFRDLLYHYFYMNI